MKESKWKPGKCKPKKSEKYPQGYMFPPSKTIRKSLKKLDLSNGSMYKKVGGWFEWN